MVELKIFDRVTVTLTGRNPKTFNGRIVGETNDDRAWHVLKDRSTEWPVGIRKRFCKPLEGSRSMGKHNTPYDDDGFRRWADDMRKRLIPKMRESEHVLMIAPNLDSKFDIEFALQIGATILLEKPLILVVAQGRVIPPKLLQIADRLVEVDFDNMNEADAQKQIRDAMNDLGRQ